MVNLILDLYGKKQWLREECGWVLYQAILGFKDQPTLYGIVTSIFQQLVRRNHQKSLESIALWIVCQGGGFDGLKLPPSIFHKDSPLDTEENRTLMTALQGTTTTTDDVEAQSNQNGGATWSNKIHSAWIIIFDASRKVQVYGDKSAAGSRFTELWNDFVDGKFNPIIHHLYED